MKVHSGHGVTISVSFTALDLFLKKKNLLAANLSIDMPAIVGCTSLP